MPLIHRVTADMFEFADVIDYAINPVNLVGVSGAGLAKEFRIRAPKHIEAYQEACRTKELRVGTVQVFTDTDQPWGIINFPTKDHFYDKSNEADIKRGLIALRELLQQERYRYASIGMPMLGCGLGKQSYDTVYPLMIEYLADLDATVFLSMAPDKTDMKPRYLLIAGPVDYGMNEKDQKTIDWAIAKSLEVKMGMSLSDYTGVVTGGWPGVDEYVGGTSFLDAKDSYVLRQTGKAPLVVKPNKARNGIAASLHQGNLMCEIADDVILIKPKGHNNNRLSAMQTWMQTQERLGRESKRIAIFGETGTEIVNEDLLLPVEADIPY